MRTAIGLALIAVACGKAPAATQKPPARDGGAPLASVSQQAPPQGRPCGALNCRAFENEAAALEYVLQSKPRVLAIGEAHAQKTAGDLDSATKRFADRLLPTLAGRSSDLVLELLIADGSCKKEQQAVAEKQKAVTREQAPTNQNEFLVLGNRAKQLGIAPHVLKPTCEQYQRIAKAGASDISDMLALIASETERSVKTLLERRLQTLIVTYGGALHNDVTPRPGRERWSFGPQLNELSGKRYVELDLIVPEYIKDTETWRALPWFAHFDRQRHAAETVVYNPSPAAFTLIFPRSSHVAPEK